MDNEEMIQAVYLGMQQVQAALPQIANALTELTVIHERQSHNTEEHKAIWQRLGEHGTAIGQQAIDQAKLETQQKACLERQKEEGKQESAVALQNRSAWIDVVKMVGAAIAGAVIILALTHGPELLSGSNTPAGSLVKTK